MAAKKTAKKTAKKIPVPKKGSIYRDNDERMGAREVYIEKVNKTTGYATCSNRKTGRKTTISFRLLATRFHLMGAG